MNNSFYHTEEEIIQGIKDGDNLPLNILYKLHFPVVLNFILNNNGTDDEAKDIFQEGFIAFYNKIKQNQFQLECQIKTYIYSICRRLWLTELKIKKKFSEKITDFEDYVLIDPQQEKQITEEETKYLIMENSLKQLGEPCKTLLLDFYIHKRNMEQITEKMGYTNTDNTKNQKYKCLQRLKKIYFTLYAS